MKRTFRNPDTRDALEKSGYEYFSVGVRASTNRLWMGFNNKKHFAKYSALSEGYIFKISTRVGGSKRYSWENLCSIL